MPNTLMPHTLPIDTCITIENDHLIIQDEHASEVQFAATDAPRVVGGIIEAILDSNAHGAPPTVADAVAEDRVKDAAVALAIALEHKEKIAVDHKEKQLS